MGYLTEQKHNAVFRCHLNVAVMVSMASRSDSLGEENIDSF